MSIIKAFRVLTLVLAAVLVPATALAGTTGFAVAKGAKSAQAQGAQAGQPVKAHPQVKVRKAKSGKANKASKAKGANGAKVGKATNKVARPKLRMKKTH